MFHVIYRWRVPPENRDAFVAAWQKTTIGIRQSTEGARGSFCMVGVDDPTEILTIAKWDSIEQWRMFIEGGKPKQMQAMHDLGEQLSHQAYEQIDDFTV